MMDPRPNSNPTYSDVKQTGEERVLPNNLGETQEENPTTHSGEAGPETDPKAEAETIRIGSRLPTQNRQCQKDWWMPWEPIRPQDEDRDEDTANLASESHGEPKNYVEALQ